MLKIQEIGKLKILSKFKDKFLIKIFLKWTFIKKIIRK